MSERGGKSSFEEDKEEKKDEKKPKRILGGSRDIKFLLKKINNIVKHISQEHNKTTRKDKGTSGEKDSNNANILISGPRGTGKELISEEIRDQISAIRNSLSDDGIGKKSTDKKASNPKIVPYFAINCAAVPQNIFESEMFGHVKGAFTSAIQDKMGKVKLAEGGILFLDEIGDLHLENQPKLLRFLEAREYTRLREDNVIRKANEIVIAATNKNLNSSSFRKDIYDRVRQHIIRTIPLKQRYEDVVFYVNHFGKDKIDFPTKCLLYSYHYPGNVRELKNLITGTNNDYDSVRREIREWLAPELQESGINTDTNFSPEENLFWKPGFEKLINQRSDAIDSLRATFNFSKEPSDKLEKWVKFYEIVTLWFYSTLSREDLAKSFSLAREKLTELEFDKTFEETYELTLPKERDVKSLGEDDDFHGLSPKAMKLYPDFMEFFNFDLE